MQLRAITALTFAAALLATTAVEAQTTFSAVDAGFYQAGLHNPTNTNYFTGQITGTESRSFFVFDVPYAAGGIESVTLRTRRGSVQLPEGSETLTIYDVTTDLTSLTSGTAGIAGFLDLGSGTTLGSSVVGPGVSTTFVDTPLNSAAVAIINAPGGPKAIGGALSSISGPDDQFVFGNTARFAPPQLLVTLEDRPALEYRTALHPNASHLKIELIMGDPAAGGTILSTLDNIAINGTLQAIPYLDSNNNGILQIQGSTLQLADLVGANVSFGILGSASLDLIGGHLGFNSDFLPVVDSQLMIGNAASVNFALDQGIISLYDPRGPLATIAGSDFPQTLDFAEDPFEADQEKMVSLGVTGSTDLGQGLLTPRAELNFYIPESLILLEEVNGVPIYARLSGSIHVAVPEPSTWALSMLAAAGVGVALRRKRKQSAGRSVLLAVTAAACLFPAAMTQADDIVESRWLDPVSGTWTTDAAWSTPVYPRNNTPAGTNYHAIIDAQGGPYTVSNSTDIAVNKLTIDSANATVFQSSGILTADLIEIVSGKLQVGRTSTIKDTTITGPAGSVVFTNSLSIENTYFDNVTLGVGIEVPNHGGVYSPFYRSSITIENGLNLLPGTSVKFNPSSTYLAAAGDQTISGSGEFVFTSQGGGSSNESRGILVGDNSTLTLGPNITVRTESLSGQLQVSEAGGTLINEGTLRSEAANAPLHVLPSSTNSNQIFENRGQVQAIGEGTVEINGNWTNTGSFVVRDNGTLLLNGSFSPDDIGTIDRQGGTIAIVGQVNNTGQILEANAGTGNLQIGSPAGSSAHIIGGTIQSTTEASWTIMQGRFEDVTIADTQTVAGSMHIVNGLTLDNSTIKLNQITFESTPGETALRGNGTFQPGSTQPLNILGRGSSFLIEPGITIERPTADTGNAFVRAGEHLRNEGTLRNVSEVSAPSIDNNGTIEVINSTTIQANGDAGFINNGEIVIRPNGSLTMQGNYSLANLGTVIDEGANRIQFGGTLRNTGQILDVDGLNWTVRPELVGTISGGTLMASTAVPISLSQTVLDGVTLSSNAVTSNRASARNGLTLDGSTLTIPQSHSFAFENTGPNLLSGNGTILATGNASISGSTLIIGDDITIRNLGSSSNSNFRATFSQNLGTIISEVPWAQVTIGSGGSNPDRWENKGTIQAVAGTVAFEGTYTLENIGHIEYLGGQVETRGQLLNSGNTLVQDTSTGTWRLRGTIEGGRIETRDGIIADLGGHLESVTLAGEGSILSQSSAGSGSLTIHNGLTFDGGQIHIGTNRQLNLGIGENKLIDGNGTILLDGASGTATIDISNYAILGAQAAIRTGENGGGIINRAPLHNLGTISAETAGQTLTVQSDLMNEGVLQAIDDSVLRIRSVNWQNDGEMLVNNGGLMEITGRFVNSEVGRISGEGTIYLGRLSDLSPSGNTEATTGWNPNAMDITAYQNSGTIAPGDGIGVLALAGNMLLNSTSVIEIELGDGLVGEFDQLDVLGMLRLDGNLNVVLTDTFVPRVGEQFDIITGLISGEFAGLDSQFIVDGIVFGISYAIDRVTLTTLGSTAEGPLAVVPEPSALALLLVGGLGLGYVARRARQR